MKGWIKVHGKSEDGRKGRTMYVRTEHIVQVSTGVLAADESKEATCIALRGEESSLYAVTESVEEVLALIEEAEKPWYVRAKEECEKRNAECVGCPIMEICNGTPRAWLIDAIPEEYR